MAKHKKYQVLVPYPKGGGHWAKKDEVVELLPGAAFALVQAGRLKPLDEPASPAPKKEKANG